MKTIHRFLALLLSLVLLCTWFAFVAAAETPLSEQTYTVDDSETTTVCTKTIVKDANGKTNTTFNKLGQPLVEKNVKGNKTTNTKWSYDASGALVKVTVKTVDAKTKETAVDTTAYTYDDHGSVAKSVRVLSNGQTETTTFEYVLDYGWNLESYKSNPFFLRNAMMVRTDKNGKQIAKVRTNIKSYRSEGISEIRTRVAAKPREAGWSVPITDMTFADDGRLRTYHESVINKAQNKSYDYGRNLSYNEETGQLKKEKVRVSSHSIGEYSDSASTLTTTKYTYNGNGTVKKTNVLTQTYNHDGLQKERRTITAFTYNKKGQCVKTVTAVSVNGKKQPNAAVATTFTYDQQGNLLQEIGKNAKGKVVLTRKLTYDAQGNLRRDVLKDKQNSKNSYSKAWAYTELDKSAYLVHHVEYTLVVTNDTVHVNGLVQGRDYSVLKEDGVCTLTFKDGTTRAVVELPAK